MSRESQQEDFRPYPWLHLSPFTCPLCKPPATGKVHAGPVVPPAPTENSETLSLCRKTHTFGGKTLSQGHFEILLMYAHAASHGSSQMDMGCLLSSLVPKVSPRGRMGTEGGRTVIQCQTYLTLEHCQEMGKKKSHRSFLNGEDSNRKP